MLCLRWEQLSLTPGIRLHRSHSLNLGVTAKERERCWVGLHRDNPPSLEGALVHDAYPFWVTPKRGDRFLVLAQPRDHLRDDDRILIHVSTRGEGKGNGRGWWSVEGGETLLAGVEERDAWSEGLILLNPGGIVRMRPARGDDDLALCYPVDGEPHVETWIRHEARQLLISEGVSTK